MPPNKPKPRLLPREESLLLLPLPRLLVHRPLKAVLSYKALAVPGKRKWKRARSLLRSFQIARMRKRRTSLFLTWTKY